MLDRYPIILTSQYQTPEYQWRLVASTYHSTLAAIESAVVLAGMLVLCFMRTGVTVFLWLAPLALIVTAVRLWDRACFFRTVLHADGPKPGTPASWMRRQVAGALAASALWGAQDVCVLLLTDEPLLQCLVLMTQAGWIAGACLRMASSPAAVLGQLSLTLMPSTILLCFVPIGLIQITIPLAVLHIIALLRITKTLGVVLLHNIESEHRVELINKKLQETNDKLARLSLIDGLTGIANRRAFDQVLAAEWGRAAREGEPLSLLMIDVDFFKLFNDQYGHQAGDDCLRIVGTHAAACIRRPADIAARYGGEEFVILLPGQDDAGAREVADRLRGLVADGAIPHEAAPLGRVSVSIGVCSVIPSLDQTSSALLRRADLALYEAKRCGRNQVHVSAMTAETG